MSQGQPIGPALDKITQQTIGAQSQAGMNKQYMEMLRKMLSGEEVPMGGKVTHDEKGTKLEIPKGIGAMGTPGAPAQNLPVMSGQIGQMDTINPFVPSQQSASAADFAGLGPQDVSRALTGATGVEALRQQSISNLLRTYETFHGPLEQDFPVKVPMGPDGIPTTVSLREWQALPQDERDYALFVQTSKKLGDADIMSRREFEMLEPTERERFVRQAMEDPKLMAATKELATAGATKISIGERVSEKLALGKLKGQLYFSDPKWTSDIEKHLGSEDMQRKIFMESQKEGGDPELMRAEETISFIERKISVGGTIQDVKLSEDGRTMTWTVKWKSGDIEDISYVVRP